MTPAQRKRYEKLLKEAKAELEQTGPARIEPNRTSEVEVGDNEDEQPLNEMLQSVASGRNKNRAAVAGGIARALARLRDDPDDFGMCQDCGDEIPAARLAAVPWAELCVACQSRRDGPKAGPTRKKLTDYR